MWVALVEKAFAHYRTGANSYASIEGGWAVEMNRAFKSASAGAKSIRSYSNATDLANDIARLWNGYQAVTIGFVGTLSGNVPLVANHMYTVHSIQRNSAVRSPPSPCVTPGVRTVPVTMASTTVWFA